MGRLMTSMGRMLQDAQAGMVVEVGVDPETGWMQVMPLYGDTTLDGQANTCTHGSATGVDTAPMGPEKVWRCDHCGLTWKQGDR